uniref:Uncharacterized protein n=1 Tax=Myotis myotis TaxID=51298 RepID=A0A7J7Z5V5_MYOMY|nr:hypothetical protein mMyoMyo1_010485 [Myotis myotis]
MPSPGYLQMWLGKVISSPTFACQVLGCRGAAMPVPPALPLRSQIRWPQAGCTLGLHQVPRVLPCLRPSPSLLNCRSGGCRHSCTGCPGCCCACGLAPPFAWQIRGLQAWLHPGPAPGAQGAAVPAAQPLLSRLQIRGRRHGCY